MTDEDTADEDRPQHAWASQTPETRIRGTVEEIIFAGQLGSSVEQPDDSFGVVLSGVETVIGTTFVNDVRDGEQVAEQIPEDAPRPTDYRFADEDDEDSTIVKGSLTTGEKGPNVYDPGEVAEDEIIVWYNGMSGQRVGRALDFNGMPFARYTDSGYLIKGLYQAAEGWRDASSAERSDLAGAGRAPRVVRAPILREDVAGSEVLIDVTRYDGGRGYELHVFDADEFEDEFGDVTTATDELPRGRYGLDVESEIEFRSVAPEEAEETIEDAGYAMHMFEGPGWQDEPENADYEPPGSDEFDVSVETADEEDVEEQWDEFASMIASNLPDGLSPDEAYTGGLESVIEKNESKFHEVPTEDQIRTRVYEQVSWLDADEIEA